jgi:hypothetical protein
MSIPLHQSECIFPRTFVHGCFAGKCILTGSMEWTYFKLDGSMEKKWDTVIPADLEKTLCKWDIICFAGHERVNERNLDNRCLIQFINS